MKYFLVLALTVALFSGVLGFPKLRLPWPWSSSEEPTPQTAKASQDPKCEPAADFAVQEFRKRGERIVSHVLRSCSVVRKEFFNLSILLNLVQGKKSCTGVTVWVRPFKQNPYMMTKYGTCAA